MPKVEMFFDHTCPYCRRGHVYLKDLLSKFPSIQIVWCPVEAHPKVEEPEHKPYEDLAVQSTFFVRDAGGYELSYHERLYRLHFDEHRKIDDVSTLAKCAAELGYNPDQFTAALNNGVYTEELRKANEYAYETQKVWAVPTFVCGTKRLDAVAGVGVTKEQLEEFLKSCV